MDDQQVLSRIDELVQEEEQLLHRHEGESSLSSRGARPPRAAEGPARPGLGLPAPAPALRESGDDPDDASTRDAGTVEGYGSVSDYDDTAPDAPA